jgi:uncharacterized protein (TIGR03435 family)
MLAAAFCLAAALTTRVVGQTPAAFEVASVKPNHSGENNSTWRYGAGGHFTGENISLRFLMTTAFRLKEAQLVDLPGWAGSEKYDIETKSAGSPTEDQIFSMLQGLLQERFQLKYHRATKRMPVYAMVPAKGGIKLQESKAGSCVVAGPESHAAAPGEPEPKYCGNWYAHGGQVDGTRITMPQLVTALTMRLDRIVIDRTRFTKAFDVQLTWNPDPGPEEKAGDGIDEGPSIFTAVQEQLGLKLEAAKAPVEILVVDHIERPSEN